MTNPQIENDEKKAQELLESKGFLCDSYTKEEKRNSKTPDFKVYLDSDLKFYYEVKSIMKDSWENGARNDPIFNRLTDDVHESIKQFDAVNERGNYPNVLILVNHDEMCKIDDLISVITGDFFAADGKRYPIYKQFSDGRIKNEKNRIHLFIWLDDKDSPRYLFNQGHRKFYLNLCKLFNKNPDNIKNILHS